MKIIKTFTPLFISLLFSLNLISQIEVLQIERHNKKLDLIIPSPYIAPEFPVGLIYQDTSGNAFTNLSDRILRIADGPIGFQSQPNPIIFSEVTKNSFSIHHYYPYNPSIFYIGPSRKGNWGPRDVSNPFYYDFHTFGDIYNIDLSSRKLSELSSYNSVGALKLYRYAGGNTYTHTLTINSAGNPVWAAISDRRVKENITTINSLLPQVLQLEMKNYNYKGLEDSTRGFIAQEVQKIFPEMVQETENGLLAVDYLGFGTLAIQAIKEQQEIIESLEDRITKIEALMLTK